MGEEGTLKLVEGNKAVHKKTKLMHDSCGAGVYTVVEITSFLSTSF